MTNKSFVTSMLGHISLFIAVEIIFVFIVYREFPAVNLYTTIGIAHLVYWAIVLACSFRREKAKTVNIRALALWTPMIVHLLIHIWIGMETIEEHGHGHEHHAEEILWLVIGTIIAGIIIYFGEKLIHKNQHCETHHTATHKDCIETSHGDCEGGCEK